MQVLYTVATIGRQSGGLARVASRTADALAEVGCGVLLPSMNPAEPAAAFIPTRAHFVGAPRARISDRLVVSTQFGALARNEIATRRADLVHHHGVWLPSNWQSANAAHAGGKPLVVSPHEILEPWAIKYHGQCKAVAEPVFQRRCLRQARMLRVSTVAEMTLPRRLVLRNWLLPSRIHPTKGPRDPGSRGGIGSAHWALLPFVTLRYSRWQTRRAHRTDMARLLVYSSGCDHSRAQRVGGARCIDGPRRHASGSRCTQAEHCPLTDDRTGGNDAMRAHPRLVAHYDRFRHQWKMRLRIVVIPGAKVCTLGQNRVRTNADLSQIVDPGRFSQPTMVADSEAPGELDSNSGLDDHSATDSCSEGAQKYAAVPTARQKAGYEQSLHEYPQDLDNGSPAARECRYSGTMVLIKSHAHELPSRLFERWPQIAQPAAVRLRINMRADADECE